MNRQLAFAILFLLLIGLLLRLLCLPIQPFFCDVPTQVSAIESGRFIIQPPGYAPYNLLCYAASKLVGSTFAAMVLITMLSGLGAIYFASRTGFALAGIPGVIALGSIASGSVFSVYFSVVGASYMVDSLCFAAILYYGVAFYKYREKKSIWAAAVWLYFGTILRPLSVVCVVFAILWLSFAAGRWKMAFAASGLFGAAALSFVLLSLPYYGSIHAMISNWVSYSQGVVETKDEFITQRLTNLFRWFVYPLYGLQVWLAWAAYLLWKARSNLAHQKWLLIFIGLLICPYLLLLFVYLPHAGYYCAVLVPLAALGLLPKEKFASLRAGTLYRIVALFWIVTSLQLFALRPVRPTGLTTLVADAYFLQYSRAGIKIGMAETLSSLAVKSNIMKDAVPASRLQQIEKGGH